MAKFYAPFRLSENIRSTPEGYLICLGVPIARTGEMIYGEHETPLEAGDDGKVIIQRDAKEVFKDVTIASFQGKSVTIKHPEDFVTPKNWAELSKGIIQNVRKASEKDEDGEETLLADLLITDDFAISLVKAGLREVSCGYEAEYEQTGKGKGRQTNIIGNHLALVEQGRAGSSYAITDHKGDETMSVKILKDLKDKLAELTKVVDSASPTASKAAGSETNVVADKEMYDELVNAVKDLSAKVEGMAKPAGDEEEEVPPKKKPKEKEEPAEDDDSEDEGEDTEILERVKALEAAMAKLLEAKAGDEEEEESEDADEEESEEEEESEDADEEEEAEDDDHMVGDAALAEILAPGVKASKKENLKVRALMEAYKTKDGEKLIKKLNGGKKPTFDSAENVDRLFLAAAHVMKAKRGNGLAGTKVFDAKAFDSGSGEAMTPEKMNEINAAHWAGKTK